MIRAIALAFTVLAGSIGCGPRDPAPVSTRCLTDTTPQGLPAMWEVSRFMALKTSSETPALRISGNAELCRIASVRYVADVGRPILIDSNGVAQLFVLSAGQLGYVVYVPQGREFFLTLWYDRKWHFLDRWGVKAGS